MTQKNSKLPLKEWEETINKMSYKELQEYIADPDVCYPESIELANDRLKELKNEDMRNTIIKIMAEMGCKNQFDEDGYLSFFVNADNTDYFQLLTEEEKHYINLSDVCFTISFDYDLRYIVITEHCWKKVRLGNVEEVERLKCAINRANFGDSVVTAYYMNEEDQTMEVSCSTSYPYLPNETYLKDFINYKITEILCKNWFINRYLEVEKMK